LEDLILACLAKTPEERPQKITEILSALSTIESQQNNTDNSKNKYYSANRLDKDKIAAKASGSFHWMAKDNILVQEPRVKDKIAAQPDPNHKSENLIHPISDGKIGTNLTFPINADEIINFVTWPTNKPIADIVFPQPLYHNGKVAPAIWVMLSQAEIMKRLHCTRYNQFLFISSPHPMLLWITVIYNRKHGPKWLHYYLDLKSSFGQEMVRLLEHSGRYHILLFAREHPGRCAHILNSTIATNQCQRLREWLQASNITRVSADPQVSKDLLKREYEKIKSKIVAKLETIDTDSPFDLSD
jgi:serine/threonine-protein kinase